MNPLAYAAAGVAACIGMTVPAAAFAQQFDPQTLKRLGISPEAAAYFSKAARFLPGMARVRLNVNGIDRGTMDVRFNDEGTLCFTPELLRHIGLKVPDGTSEEGCQDYRKAYPETDIATAEPVAGRHRHAAGRPRPAEEAIQGQYVSGGTAAMINYNLSGSRSTEDSGYQYLRAYSETGLNVADWILRSRQDYYSQGGRSTFTQGIRMPSTPCRVCAPPSRQARSHPRARCSRSAHCAACSFSRICVAADAGVGRRLSGIASGPEAGWKCARWER